jgi:hypothetical protein
LKAAALRVPSKERIVDELDGKTIDVRMLEAEEGFHKRVDNCIKHL